MTRALRGMAWGVAAVMAWAVVMGTAVAADADSGAKSTKPAPAAKTRNAKSTKPTKTATATDKSTPAPTMQRLDDVRVAAPWVASGSDDVRASLRTDKGGGICLDYDFRGVSGYAVMRRPLALDLPADYAFHLRVSGSGSANSLQFKLLDATGENVWWARRENFAPSVNGEDLRFKRRHITFAWGPSKDRELRRAASMELVMAGGKGGKGTLCLTRLDFEPRATQTPPPPLYAATETFGADVPANAFDGRSDTAWQAPGGEQSLQIDFGVPREWSGIVLRWRRDARAVDYDIDASDDGRKWTTLRRVRGASGALDTLFMPESEARFVRLSLKKSNGERYALVEMELPDHTRWQDLNALLGTRAAAVPRGDVPRAMLGEQNYWTLVGVDGGGANSALISEDGAVEIHRGGFSVEPSVLLDDGTRITWANAKVRQSLRDRYLPLPEVHWEYGAFALDIEVAADGPRDAPLLAVRYTLQNRTNKPLPLTLALAVRPWQVNPPQQFLNTPGGASNIGGVKWDAGTLTIDGRTSLRTTELPARVSAAPFDAGIELASVESRALASDLVDPQRMISASLGFAITLPANGVYQVGWMAPLVPGMQVPVVTHGDLNVHFDAAARGWRDRLNRTVLRVPAESQPIVDTLRTSLAHILMSRDGPALRPGTRSYARTWVRDGAMMVAALVALGERDVAREFVDWYAGQIFSSGKVPCCVDARGPDPVAENDSHGQYLYAVAEVYRHTQDAAWLAKHWPDVARVTGYMESLRQSMRDPRRKEGAEEACFGLMPPSISHEGYSDKPACSYWDDFWALRGYKDAVMMARALGKDDDARKWEGWRDEFTRDLVTSLDVVAKTRNIDFIPGAADRGDFDPTSTTVALNPAQALDVLPADRLAATFDRYAREAALRAESQRTWKEYTPYELRNVGALTRLRQADRAHELLRFFFDDQRPRAWRQWAEVVGAQERVPRFVGDMPHAWVSSDYIRAVLDFFAYERERDATLILGAGIPVLWLDNDGVSIEKLSTRYGLLSYRITRGDAGWTLDVTGDMKGLTGGVRYVWPGDGPLPRATQNGRRIEWEGRELPIANVPASVLLRY